MRRSHSYIAYMVSNIYFLSSRRCFLFDAISKSFVKTTLGEKYILIFIKLSVQYWEAWGVFRFHYAGAGTACIIGFRCTVAVKGGRCGRGGFVGKGVDFCQKKDGGRVAHFSNVFLTNIWSLSDSQKVRKGGLGWSETSQKRGGV